MAAEELEGWGATDAPEDGYASEAELDTRKLMQKKNRNNKKSGGFQSLGLSTPVFRGVLKKGYNVPTPIQRKTIPLVLEGKDVVAMARTGSGKTACFLIPLFEKLQYHSPQNGARALILSPTRELAIQTLKFTKELGKYTGLRAAVVLGGDSLEGQFAALHENPDIIIATPGRLVHVCVEMDLKLQSIEYVVFDEADRLYEMGFAEQLNDLLGRLPETRQTLLFSATLPKMLVEFARAGLSDPVLIRLDAEHVLSENLKLAFFKCNTDDKLGLLFHVLEEVISDNQQVVIFAATKHHIEYLHLALDYANISNTLCYSTLDPTARKINVAKFKTRRVRCLLVTDIAARGIDIPFLDNVINYNFPGKPKIFVHRVGRVARAGRSGVAYSFIAPDESAYLLDLHLFLSKELRIAPHPPDYSKRADWNYMYGSVPQAVLDNETEKISNMHRHSSDVAKAKNTSINGYKQYTITRPAASVQSSKRMKETELVTTIGYHPLLISKIVGLDLEEQRLAMLTSLKHLQPKGTVFEMIRTKKKKDAKAVARMKEKREHDRKKIESFHKKLETRQEAQKEKEDTAKQVAAQVGKMEMSTEDEVQNAFSSIVCKVKNKGKKKIDISTSTKAEKRNNCDENTSSKKKKKVDKENEGYKDKEFYIPYTRSNMFADHGYSVGSSFHHATEQAALDLIGDDDKVQRQTSALHKWDRYKKKFVGTQNQQKRIKTESGVWIAASYKTDRYQKWMSRGKTRNLEDSSDEEDGSQAGPSKKTFQTIRKPSHGKKHPLLRGKQPVGKKPPKRELRTEAEIIKENKRLESERQKHLEGNLKRQKKMTTQQKHEIASTKKERAKMQARNIKKQNRNAMGKRKKK